jgi:Ca2+-binding RTX toxin-like protein
MTTNTDPLLHAILAMDSYNRGYNAAIQIDAEYVGNAAFLVDSFLLGVDEILGRNDEVQDFYAASYVIPDGENPLGQTIISYRGTDSLGDMNTGWGLGADNHRTQQADMSIDFYRLLVAEENLFNENITLTGHSLGGGLAGFVAGMYNQDAIVYNHMPYEDALQNAGEDTNPGDEILYDEEYKIKVYGDQDSINPNNIGHIAYSTEHEVLKYIRGLQTNTTAHYPPFALSDDDTNLDLVPYNFDWWQEVLIPSYDEGPNPSDLYTELQKGFTDTRADAIVRMIEYFYGGGIPAFIAAVTIGLDPINEAIARHSQATLVLRLLFQKIDGSDTGEWLSSGKFFWPLLYNKEFASSIGLNASYLESANFTGVSVSKESFSDIMRTTLAYSALESDNGLVFGNTGARSLHNDATDLGKALSASGAAASIESYAADIGRAFVHYASHLALSHVGVALASTSPDVRSGILEYDTNDPDALVVNFKSSDWMQIEADLKPTMAVTRDALVDSILDDLYNVVPGEVGVNLESFIQNNWLTLPTDAEGTAFNRIVFSAIQSGSTESLSATHEILGAGHFKSTLFVGSSSGDHVTVAPHAGSGLHDSTVFLGYNGENIFTGGNDRDIAIGGIHHDEFDGGADEDFLFGYDGNDWLKGGDGDDIVIGGTGNDDFIADKFGDDVYHGGFDTDDLDPFWNGIPMDLMDITRQNDGLDLVDYMDLTDVFFDITLLDAVLGNYWVDKYYGNSVFNGPSDRDTLFSIETLQVAAGAARQVGGQSILGTSAGEHLIYGSISSPYSYYGFGGVDTLTGGNKNDYLNGGADPDTLVGKVGDDTYYYGHGDGDDTITDLGSTTDFDVLIFGAGIAAADVTLARYHTLGDKMTILIDNHDTTTSTIIVDNQNYTGYGIDYIKFTDGTVWDMQGTLVTVYGTEGADAVIKGTMESSYREGSLIDDVIYALGGNDNVQAYGGNDTIYGGDGNDAINAGDGQDIIYGGSGDDSSLEGWYGDDVINGESGNDTLKGNNGNDLLYGGSGLDVFYAGNDNDTLYGGSENDTMRGENGNDTLYGGSGLDSLYGGGGTDTFVFEASSAFANIDIVNDYNKTSQNDVIDISDVLFGFYDYGIDVITDFVQITQTGSNSLLYVDQDGGANNFLQIAALYNVTGLTNEATLEASGHLITV